MKMGTGSTCCRRTLRHRDPLKQIAEAPKRATLVEVPGTRPAHKAVPEAVLKLVGKELWKDEMSVGVIVNRVRTAREVHEALPEEGNCRSSGDRPHAPRSTRRKCWMG